MCRITPLESIYFGSFDARFMTIRRPCQMQLQLGYTLVFKINDIIIELSDVI